MLRSGQSCYEYEIHLKITNGDGKIEKRVKHRTPCKIALKRLTNNEN